MPDLLRALYLFLKVISACVGKAVTTKTVTGEYEKMLQKLGNEFDILREIPIADIEKEVVT